MSEPIDQKPIDTLNRCLIAAVGSKLAIMRLPTACMMTHDEAAVMAAYLVAMGVGRKRFLEVLDAVEQA